MSARNNVRIKDPASILKYTLDWTNRLSTNDTIATSVWALETGIVNDDDTNTTTTATVKISGGTANTYYEVKNTITTTNGETMVYRFTLKIRET